MWIIFRYSLLTTSKLLSHPLARAEQRKAFVERKTYGKHRQVAAAAASDFVFRLTCAQRGVRKYNPHNIYIYSPIPY